MKIYWVYLIKALKQKMCMNQKSEYLLLRAEQLLQLHGLTRSGFAGGGPPLVVMVLPKFQTSHDKWDEEGDSQIGVLLRCNFYKKKTPNF